MTGKAKVVITRELPGPHEIPGATVTMAPDSRMPREELLRFIRGADAVISMFYDRVDDEFLDAAGPQLKGVCNYAVGYNNFDLAACKRRNVLVTNTPDAVTEGTANLAFALILDVARRLAEADRYVRTGAFERDGNPGPKGWMGMHLTGQELLIVGPGRIGRAVALRALAFGMRIAYAGRTRKLEWELAPLVARRVDLDQGLAEADVVSVHTPLTEETRHLISARRIALLKPTAIIVNTARGPIIDEAALADALANKKIYGAGLDVFEHEPKVHPKLLTLDNVVMAPHIGSAEVKYREVMTELACENAAAIIAGKRPPNLVQ